MTPRELSLAGLALSEGRALVVAANKLDVLPPADRVTYLDTLGAALESRCALLFQPTRHGSPRSCTSLRFVEAGRLPIVGMSALLGGGGEQLLPVVQRAFASWNKRCPRRTSRASPPPPSLTHSLSLSLALM